MRYIISGIFFMLMAVAYVVPLHPSHDKCEYIGELSGLTTAYEEAGTLYYVNLRTPMTVTLPFGDAQFDVAGYDNDGTPYTGYHFWHNDVETSQFNMKTGQNKWSEWYGVIGTDRLLLDPPKNHNSTWICFRSTEFHITTTPTTEIITPTITATIVPTIDIRPTDPITMTPTVVSTPTPNSTPPITPTVGTPVSAGDVGIIAAALVQGPTNLTPVPEVAAANANQSITINVKVYAFKTDMKNVRVMGDGLDYVIPLLKVGHSYVYEYQRPIETNTNVIVYTVSSDTPDDNPFNNKYSLIVNGVSELYLPFAAR